MNWIGLRFGLAFIGVGIWFVSPQAVLLGLVTLLIVGMTRLWSRSGLRDLHYERTIASDRTVWGEDLPMELAVLNDKPIPVPMVSVEDFATQEAVVREQPLAPCQRWGLAILASRWRLGVLIGAVGSRSEIQSFMSSSTRNSTSGGVPSAA